MVRDDNSTGKVIIISSRAADEETPSAMLIRRGYDVSTVPAAEDAVARLRENDGDLVLYDAPDGRDGICEKIGLLRESGGGVFCSLVMLMDSCTHEDRIRLFESGADDIIETPVDADELCAKARVHLENAMLRKELAARNAELEEKNADLAHLVDLKNRFLDLATHDIRTPITTMKLVSDVVEKHAGTLDGFERIKKPLDILARNIARIEAKIDEFMLIAKLDLRRMILNIGPLNLSDIVRDVTSSFFSNAIGRGVDLDASLVDVPAMKGDAHKIGQLVYELIETSLERLDTGGHMLVKTRLEGDGVWIRVTDNGVPMEEGAPEKLLADIEAEDVDSEARVPLYNACRIAKAHGGRLTIASDEAAGTLFAAWIPLEARAEQEDKDE